MIPQRFAQILETILRVMLAAVFLYAGAAKLKRPGDLAESIHQFQIIPDSWINLVALALPPLEIIIGAMLLAAWVKRAAALASLILLLLFSVALFQALVRGMVIDCGCFGASAPSWWLTVAALGRDVLLLAMAGYVYARNIPPQIEL